jgi:hypothetical protein
MQTLRAGISISTVILICYRLYLIFSLTAVPASTCRTDLLTSYSVGNDTYVRNSFGHCDEGYRVFYDYAGIKTARKLPCSKFRPEFFENTECIAFHSKDSRTAIAIQITLIFAHIFLFACGMANPLRALNLVSCFFQLADGLMSDGAIIAAVLIASVFGDFLFSITFPGHQTDSFLGGYDMRIRTSNGRFKK